VIAGNRKFAGTASSANPAIAGKEKETMNNQEVVVGQMEEEREEVYPWETKLVLHRIKLSLEQVAVLQQFVKTFDLDLDISANGNSKRGFYFNEKHDPGVLVTITQHPF
jgi:hypothetical protein